MEVLELVTSSVMKNLEDVPTGCVNEPPFCLFNLHMIFSDGILASWVIILWSFRQFIWEPVAFDSGYFQGNDDSCVQTTQILIFTYH